MRWVPGCVRERACSRACQGPCAFKGLGFGKLCRSSQGLTRSLTGLSSVCTNPQSHTHALPNRPQPKTSAPTPLQVEVGSIVEAQRVTVARVQDAVQAALANGTSGNKAAAAAAGPSAAGAKRPANGSAAGSKAAAAAGPVAKRSRMMAAIESFGSDDGSDSSSEGEDA